MDHGADFHAKDLENMKENPAMYGIKSHFQNSISQNVPGSSKSAEHKASMVTPSVELSTLKMMWFPIFGILIELILESPEPTRQQALSCLERIITGHHDHFKQDLWREIFSQTLLPALNATKFKVQTAESRDQIIHFTQTLRMILESFNRVFVEQASGPKMLKLVTSYSDILCLFASMLGNQDLAMIVMGQLRFLIQGLSSMSTTQQHWSEIIEQLGCLFQLSQPVMLKEEMKNFQTH